MTTSYVSKIRVPLESLQDRRIAAINRVASVQRRSDGKSGGRVVPASQAVVGLRTDSEVEALEQIRAQGHTKNAIGMVIQVSESRLPLAQASSE